MASRTAPQNASTPLDAEAWIDAGFEALAEGGTDAVRIDPLAKSLGVTRGSFYGDYFHNKEKSHLLIKFENSFSGTYDMYIMFFELSLKIIKNLGKLCFITPNTYLDFSQFSKLRSVLIKDNNIEIVIELPKVFADAIVENAIIILTKNKFLAQSRPG